MEAEKVEAEKMEAERMEAEKTEAERMEAEKVEVEKMNAEKTEEKTLEEAFGELEVLAAKLEDRETTLEESFSYYKQGMELLKLCSEKLDTVEKKMLQMNEDGTLSEFSR